MSEKFEIWSRLIVGNGSSGVFYIPKSSNFSVTPIVRTLFVCSPVSCVPFFLYLYIKPHGHVTGFRI